MRLRPDLEAARAYARAGEYRTLPVSTELLSAYRVLRTKNPSPYMLYLSGTDVEVAGASPETLEKAVRWRSQGSACSAR